MSLNAASYGNKTKDFVIFLAQSAILFFLLTYIVTFLRMNIAGDDFAVAWRWIHDTLLVPIFWYISPYILIMYALDIFLEQNKRKGILTQLPLWIHKIITVFLALATSSLFSQLFGGCAWFYFTENWWERFVPPALENEDQAIVFYVLYTAVALITVVTYWSKYVYNNPNQIKHQFSAKQKLA